jgi:hypothetical protein
MANGIEDLNTDFLPDGTSEGVIDILKQKAYEQVTNFMNQNNIPVTPNDTKRIVEDGVVGGDPRVVLDIVNEKLTNVPNEVKAQLAGELIAQAGMLTTPVGQLNALNATLQKGGDYVQGGLDFARSKLDPDSRGANILGTTSDIIEGGKGIFGGMTGDLNRTMGNVVYNPIYGFVNLAGKNVIDPIASRINPLLNLFSKRKSQPEPVPVQLTNDQINQIVKDEVNLNPPTPTFSPQDMNIQPAPAPAQPAFSPQDMNIQSYSPPSYVGGGGGGRSYRNVVNRANGGLVSVSRYLKGR